MKPLIVTKEDRENLERRIIAIMFLLSIFTAFINISIGIYFGVMTNVVVNFFKYVINKRDIT